MIFTGDIAQPFVEASFADIPDKLKAKVWLVNLEGSLIEGKCMKEDIRGVYNQLDVISELLKLIPFSSFSIANNHLLDAAEVQTTLDNAQKLGVPVVGDGGDLQDAQKPLVVTDSDGTSYRVLALGWKNIQRMPAQQRNRE